MLTSSGVILCGRTTGTLDPILTISTWGISLNFFIMYSRFWSEIKRASPPDSNTSLITGVFAIYSIALFTLSIGIALSFCPANLLLVQCLQYIAHWSVINKSALSGYLCVSPGTGESASS